MAGVLGPDPVAYSGGGRRSDLATSHDRDHVFAFRE